jgi:HEPN domain-containing protein
MSVDKQAHEAMRWLETAEEDLAAARVLLREAKYSHACFLAQHSGEKAVKALWYFLGEDPWGHSIHKLILDLPDGNAKMLMAKIQDDAAALDRFYIPTRYPNGLPDLTPGRYYFQKDAEFAIRIAESIITLIRRMVAATD